MATRFWSFIVPKNQQFFGLFNQASANVLQMAKLLYDVVNNPSTDEGKMIFNHIERLKMKGNEVKHQVYLSSAKAFVSPFERNDMYALASIINTVCDHIHIASRRINIYQSDDIASPIKELSGIIVESATELDNAVKSLDNLKNDAYISSSCNKIKQLEHYADKVYNTAISSIMINEKSSVELIKYTEILAAFEKVTDRCEDATDVIESIIIKNK